MSKLAPFFICILLSLVVCQPTTNHKNQVAIEVSFSDSVSSKNVDGRLLLMLSTNNDEEPRFQIGVGLKDQLIYGMNVDGLAPNESVTFNEGIFGFPIPSLQDISPGDYYVQALLHTYETFNLATGQTVKLPMDNGEGQQWNKSPGNLYSKPTKITVTEKAIQNMSITLDQVIPEIEEPEDTKWIKHIKIKSEKLSKFWGRDTYLGAHVLLPKGFEEHPEAKYPLMVFFFQVQAGIHGLRSTPRDGDLKTE